ncbi:MAG: hypothetical protein CMF50_02960 [Legionellales bacterium]|nr:hypothetical protein [Legionellales bacterium]|tara:strand:- start:35658 stop:36008 length:351 start_codon:yes stop_codon:yes gene_type:complete
MYNEDLTPNQLMDIKDFIISCAGCPGDHPRYQQLLAKFQDKEISFSKGIHIKRFDGRGGAIYRFTACPDDPDPFVCFAADVAKLLEYIDEVSVYSSDDSDEPEAVRSSVDSRVCRR